MAVRNLLIGNKYSNSSSLKSSGLDPGIRSASDAVTWSPVVLAGRFAVADSFHVPETFGA